MVADPSTLEEIGFDPLEMITLEEGVPVTVDWFR